MLSLASGWTATSMLFPHHRSSTGADQAGELHGQDDAVCTAGTTQGMVHPPGGQDDSASSPDSSVAGSPEAASIGHYDAGARDPAAACLQTVCWALKAKGFSSPVMATIVGSRSRSTLAVYD